MNIIAISNGQLNEKTKKEVMYIERRLRELDLGVMEVFAIKEVETVEQHTSLYSTRLVLWHYTKTNCMLGKLLEFLQRTFRQFFCFYYKGNECFGHFLGACTR